MNSGKKKLLLFTLAAELKNIIKDYVKEHPEAADDQISWRAEKLSESATLAIAGIRDHVRIDKSFIKMAEKKINELYNDGEVFEITELLSFLLLGIQELQVFCKDTRMIDIVYRRTLWFTTLFDPKLEQEDIHSEALRKYREWIN